MLAEGPDLYMVDSDRGITNLHVPSDVIVDASMPALIRSSGQGWDADGEQQDTKCVIPDSSYAALYQATIDHCREHGAFDPATMGTTPNVGLMAQKAEEYGSHDKTFEIEAPGTVRVVNGAGETLLEHEVEAGDIWRMCQTKDAPIQDWVRLAVARARATGAPAVFWLDETRPHDAELLKKVRPALEALDTDGVQIEILPVAEAARFTLERARARRGHDLGDRQRPARLPHRPVPDPRARHEREDALDRPADGAAAACSRPAPAARRRSTSSSSSRRTTCAGTRSASSSRSRPRSSSWPSRRTTPARRVLGEALDRATGRLLEEGRSPSRKAGELDNRGSHAYLAIYWAAELAAQTDDAELAAELGPLAERLAADEEQIVAELNGVQGEPVDIGGYFRPDVDAVAAAMRPSETLNAALEAAP